VNNGHCLVIPTYTTRLFHIIMFRIPVTSPLGQQIEELPDGRIEVNTSVGVLVKVCADGVAMIDCAIHCSCEDTQTRHRAVRAFHVAVMIEGIVVAGKETNAVPASLACEVAHFGNLSLCHNHKICSLHDVGRDSIVAISPHTTHRAGRQAVWASTGHHMVYYKGVVPIGKQIREAYIDHIYRVILVDMRFPSGN
jgi:hypothetical protein